MSPVIGTSGADVLRAQASVTFVWVPLDYKYSYVFPVSPRGSNYAYKRSTASGKITVEGVSPSEPVSVIGQPNTSVHFEFQFTNGTKVSGRDFQLTGTVYWNQTRDTFFLGHWNDSVTPTLTVDASRTIQFHGQSMELLTDPPNHAFVPWQLEYGRWELLAEPRDTFVSAGAGNDTVYGGQGANVLLGGAGQDVIYLGPGNGTALGGTGNDTIWGGRGNQVLEGGAGNDELHFGMGSGFVSGGPGNDYIHGNIDGADGTVLDGGAGDDVISLGHGDITAFGGAGADTIGAGWGTQRLEGGAGDDLLISGFDHQTFVGGGGRDVFALIFTRESQFYRAIEVEDFQPGRDIVQVWTHSNWPLTLTNLSNALKADSNGDALLELGSTVLLQGIRASDVLANPSRYLLSVGNQGEYIPEW